jgi:hypothetical protein
VLLALASSAWPIGLVLLLAVVYGATAIGWNGVQISEVARRAPPGTAGSVTGASGFLTFSGVMTGPILFSIMVGITGSYRAGFLMAATISGVAAATLLRRGSRNGPG